MNILEISQLSTGYTPGTDALHQVDMVIPNGTIIGVIGTNGAGKSTLLKSVAGLMTVRSGTINYAGQMLPVEDAARRVRRGIALLPEGHRVLRGLTVEENLRLAAIPVWPRGVKPRLEKLLPKIYELFPVIRNRQKQLAGLLSGGEQQMLSISRALISEPRLLLLDEPSLGLAPVVIDRIYETLDALRDSGLSMLIVEQDYSRLNKVCSNIHVLQLGRIKLSSAAPLTNTSAVQSAYFGV